MSYRSGSVNIQGWIQEFAQPGRFLPSLPLPFPSPPFLFFFSPLPSPSFSSSSHTLSLLSLPLPFPLEVGPQTWRGHRVIMIHKKCVSGFGYIAVFSNAGGSKLSDVENDAQFLTF